MGDCLPLVLARGRPANHENSEMDTARGELVEPHPSIGLLHELSRTLRTGIWYGQDATDLSNNGNG